MKKHLVWICVLVALLLASFFLTYYISNSFEGTKLGGSKTNLYPTVVVDGSDTQTGAGESIALETATPPVQALPRMLAPHERTEPIRGVYIPTVLLSSAAGRERILRTLEGTRINAVVIDVKDSSGFIYLPKKEGPYAFAYQPMSATGEEFFRTLKDRGIYMIGRLVVFQDPLTPKQFPEYALKDKSGVLWKDRKGLSFLDPQNKKVWEHVKELSLDAREFGYDEINYDYIRYPSDGLISNINYHMPEGKNKSDMIENFFMYLSDEIRTKAGIPISADIFGDTVRLSGDPGIGQVFEKTLPHFDAVAPMVYASHFSPGSYGILKPDSFPKEMIQGVARDTNRRFDAWCLASVAEADKKVECSKTKNRPWLQDFSLHMTYGYSEVHDQIKALEDAGIDSWLLWNPSGRYTVSALK